jgi:hypothetical protein
MSALRSATKPLAAAAVAAAVVAVPASVALANTTDTTDTTDAPSARAAAYVNANGTLQHGKNIIFTFKESTGNYCVRVGNDIDLSKAVVQATTIGTRAILGVIAGPTSTCHNRANTITVYSWAYNAQWQDAPFYLTIP